MEILQRLYTNVWSLRGWIQSISANQRNPEITLPDLSDSNSFHEFLEKTVVAVDSSYKEPSEEVSLSQNSSQKEIVLRVIEKIHRKEATGQNMLTLGFGRISDDPNAYVSSLPSLEYKYPNSCVNRLHSSNWKKLLSRIGEVLMEYLLENTSIFAFVPPSCYIQTTGTPIYDLSYFKGTAIKQNQKARKQNVKQSQKAILSPPIPYHNATCSKHPEDIESGSSSSKSAKTLHKTIDVNTKHKHLIDQDKHFHELQQRAMEYARQKGGGKGKGISLKRKLSDESSDSEIGQRSKIIKLSENQNILPDQLVNEELVPKQSIECRGEAEVTKARPLDGSRRLSRKKIMKEKQRKKKEKRQKNLFGSRNAANMLQFDNDSPKKRKLPDEHPEADKPSSSKTRTYDSDCCIDIGDSDADSCCPEGMEELFSEMPYKGAKRYQPEKSGKNRKRRERKRQKKKEGKVAVNSDEVLLGKPYVFHTYFSRTSLLFSKGMKEQLPNDYVLNSLPSTEEGALLLYKRIFDDDAVLPESSTDVKVTMQLPDFAHPEELVSDQTFDLVAESEITETGQLVQDGMKEDTLHQKTKTIEFIPEVIPSLQKMIQSHKKFRYRVMLNLYSSGKFKFSKTIRSKKARNQVRTDDVSTVHQGTASSMKANTDKSGHSSHRKISTVKSHRQPCLTGKVFHRGKGGTQFLMKYIKKEKVKRINFTKFLSQYVSHREVFLFMKRILDDLVPTHLFGDKANKKLFYSKMQNFISMRRYDKCCLGQFMDELKTKHIAWLHGVKSHWTKCHLMAKVIHWLVTEILMQCLKAFFYITESTVGRNRLFYYRKTVWQKLWNKGFSDLLRKGRVEPISKSQALQQLADGTSLGLGSVRFLPKAKSLRMIINLSKQPPAGSQQTIPINKQLLNLFHVLTYYKKKTPDLIGASVFGMEDIYKAWKKFALQHNNRVDKFYFVKLDFSSCFDCIERDKLFSIVEQVLDKEEPEEFIVRKFVSVVATGNQLRRRFHRKVKTLAEFDTDFITFIRPVIQEENFHNMILSDQVVCQHENSSSLLKQFKNHLYNNILKIGKNYCQQKKGISQGSILSTLLCNLYFGHMEMELFPLEESDLLMRMVDDSLFVTSNRHRAVQFLTKMFQGVPEFNFEVNSDKVLLNFSHTDKEGFSFPQVTTEWFPYCGMLFHTEDLHVSLDTSRFSGCAISDTMTFDVAHEAGKSMKNKLIFSLRAKTQAIFLDTQLNSLEVAITNCSKIFIILALKFHGYNLALPVTQRVNSNVNFFTGMIRDLANNLYNKTELLVQSKIPGSMAPTPTLPQCYVQWICLHSFLLLNERHVNMYKALNKVLRRMRKSIGERIDKEESGITTVLQTLCGTRLSEEWDDIIH